MSVQTRLKRHEIAERAREHDDTMKLEREKSKRAAGAQVASAIASGIAKGATSAILGGSGAAARGATALASGAAKFMKNHPSWYKKWIDDPLFANIPTWMSRSATRANMVPSDLITDREFNANDLPSDEQSKYHNLPSVVVHNFVPTLAYINNNSVVSGSATDVRANFYPINESLKVMLTNIGKVNSRTINPDNSIPGLYILNGCEIISIMGEIKFLINIIDQFQDNDPSIPRLFIEGKGWDYSFILKHIAELRKIYAEFQSRFNITYPIPCDISLIERRFWLNTLLIKDATSPKPTYQMFKQVLFSKYDENGERLYGDDWYIGSTGQKKDLRAKCVSDDSFAYLINYIRSMFDSIFNDEDMMTFVSNLRAAYSGRFFSLPNYDDNKITTTNIDDEVRQQLMNINTFPLSVSKNMLEPNNYSSICSLTEVHYDIDGNLLCKADTSTNANAMGGLFTDRTAAVRQRIEIQVAVDASTSFNSFKESITNDDILTMTRLKTIYTATIVPVSNPGSTTTYYGNRFYFWVRNTEVVISSAICEVNRYNNIDKFNVGTVMPLSIWDNAVYYTDGTDQTAISFAYTVDGMYPLYTFAGEVGDPIIAAPLHEWDNCFAISLHNLTYLSYYCNRSLYYTDPSAFSKFNR